MPSLQAVGKGLLVVTLLEVSLGGGGRLIDTGPISPRMMLFGLCVAYSAAMLLGRAKLPRQFAWFIGLFVALSFLSAAASISEGQSLPAAFNDFKPLAYFLLLPFFAITIRTVDDVKLVSRVLKISAVILALSYLLAMGIWKSGSVTTEQMIGLLNPDHDPQLEFYFRGHTTFYFKAILYLGVGVFLFMVERTHIGKICALLLVFAVALSMTRGVWLAIYLILAAWAFLEAGNRLRGAAIATVLLGVGLGGVAWMSSALPSATLSNSIRMNDLITLAEGAPSILERDWRALLAGYGFGATVLGRQAIELTYINIVWKQGIAGILFWLLPIAYVAWCMCKIREKSVRQLAAPYLMATAFVYLVSATNPFLTNPIGMAVVMISMVVVAVIRASDSALILESTGRLVAADREQPISSLGRRSSQT